MESSADLKNKLKIAEKIESIENKINQSKCPVCGGNLKYKTGISTNECYSYAYGKIFCTCCNTFSDVVERNSYEAYHWNFDGSSELELLEDTFNKVKNYLK
jgi:hypothetical protein